MREIRRNGVTIQEETFTDMIDNKYGMGVAIAFCIVKIVVAIALFGLLTFMVFQIVK